MNPIVFPSFDTGSLRNVRTHLPQTAIGFVTWARYPLEFAVIAAAEMNADAVCVHVTSLGTEKSSPAKHKEIARSLRMCAELNIDVTVWGAKPDDVPRLLDQGADALTVDHVRETRRLIDTHPLPGEQMAKQLARRPKSSPYRTPAPFICGFFPPSHARIRGPSGFSTN